jgi:hypothetical protein
MGRDLGAIGKLDYVYKFIDSKTGNEETALQYLRDVAKVIDGLHPELKGVICPDGAPIPQNDGETT